MEVILATFGKLLLLYLIVRCAIWVVNIFIRITRGGMYCFPPLLLLGQASPFITFFDDSAEQMKTDFGATIAIGLSVSSVVVGSLIAWRLFQNLAADRKPGARKWMSNPDPYSYSDPSFHVRGKDGNWHYDSKANWQNMGLSDASFRKARHDMKRRNR